MRKLPMRIGAEGSALSPRGRESTAAHSPGCPLGERALPGRCAWLRKRPFFALAVVLVMVVAGWSLLPWLGIGIALALAIWIACRWSWRQALLCLCACGVALAVLASREGRARTAEQQVLAMPERLVQAIALEDARGSIRRWSVPVRLESPLAGQLVRWQGCGPLPLQGCRLQARGRFESFPVPRNPGEFDRAAWWRRQGMIALFQQVDVEAELEDSAWVRWSAAFRHGFRERLTAGLDEQGVAAQVIRAVVLGEKPVDAESLIDAFRLSGSLHVFSVSGLHVAMVGLIGWAVLGACGVPRRWALWLLLPWIFGYAWLTGSHPPAMRAAWMAAVFLGAFVWRRPPDLLNALGAVLLLGVLWDPRCLHQPGVQLSYGVVAALGVGVPWVSARLRWLDAPDLYLPLRQAGWWRTRWWRLRQWLARSLSVSLTAGVGAAPLSAWHFGVLTPVSVLSALVLVPMVFLLLLLTLLSVALSPLLPPVSRGINHLNGGLATALAAAADGFARLPGAHCRVARRPPPSLIVYDLDRGDGAACFTGGGASAVLFDCGGRGSFRYQVLPSLRNLGLQPDSVVLSHPDAGHLGGGRAVWQSLPLKQALLPVRQARSASYGDWLQQAAPAGVALWFADELHQVPLPDGAWLEVLHVAGDDLRQATADQRVMVSRMHWRGWTWLWTSDAGSDIEEALLDAGVDVSADVIVAGRPSASSSLDEAFLSAVSPRVVVAHAKPRRHAGVEWIDLSEHGGLTFVVDETGCLQVDACASGSRWELEKCRVRSAE